MEQPSGLDSLYGILGGEGVREVFCVGGGGQNFLVKGAVREVF